MARPTTSPRDQERPFGHDELFFSTTDRKGVISGGNDVFVRVSGHAREQLIGSAHNIIRHPDMPRAVFKLLWDYLDADRPFAGYVKNMAADGCYYWVVALVVPTRQGYLSVRFKPSGALFPIVKDLYAELLAIERSAGDEEGAWRDGMQRAVEALSAAIRAKGFANYDDFMHTMLASELTSHQASSAGRSSGDVEPAADRDGELRRTLARCAEFDSHLADLFSEVDGFLAVIKNLDGKAAFLLDLSSNIHLVSLNALIGSCRLEGDGEGFSVVTQNLAALSQEGNVTIDTMTRQLTGLTSSLRETAFGITAAKLQVEMTVFFLRELLAASRRAGDGAPAEVGTGADIGTLVESFSASTIQLAAAVPRARQLIPGLMRLQEELAGDLRKLASVRLLGKIHAAGLADEAHFRELLDRILDQLQQAGAELDVLASGIAELRQQLPSLERSASLAQGTVQGFRGWTSAAA